VEIFVVRLMAIFFDEDSHGNGCCARLESASTRVRKIALPSITVIAMDAGAQSADNLRTPHTGQKESTMKPELRESKTDMFEK
jgi:hypothetical protein